MGGKLQKVDRIRSISMQDQLLYKTEKNSLREKIMARGKTRRWKVRIVASFQVIDHFTLTSAIRRAYWKD